MNNDQTVCSLYFLSEQNIILPPAELLVSLCLKASVANLHCTDWLYVCMLSVRGRGGGESGFPAALSAHWARWTLANFLDPDQTALQFV